MGYSLYSLLKEVVNVKERVPVDALFSFCLTTKNGQETSVLGLNYTEKLGWHFCYNVICRIIHILMEKPTIARQT